jgi:hypothetical protein
MEFAQLYWSARLHCTQQTVEQAIELFHRGDVLETGSRIILMFKGGPIPAVIVEHPHERILIIKMQYPHAAVFGSLFRGGQFEPWRTEKHFLFSTEPEVFMNRPLEARLSILGYN